MAKTWPPGPCPSDTKVSTTGPARIGASIPWQAAGEVVARSGSAKETVEAWLAGAGHKSQIEGDYDLTGVGVAENKKGAGYYFDQIFIRMR